MFILKKTIIAVFCFCMLFSGVAFGAEDFQKDTMSHINFVDYKEEIKLPNNMSIDFINLHLIELQTNDRDEKFYYSKGKFLWDVYPLEISLHGVTINITNNSNEMKIIKWSESTIELGYYNGLPFLDNMQYKDAGNPTKTLDTIVPPGKTISRDIYIAKTSYNKEYGWSIIGTLIPKSNTLTANLYMKIVDENGIGKYYTANSPHIGLVN